MRVEINESNILAQGVQGRVYPITKINDNQMDDYLAKIYYKNGQEKRIKNFIDYLIAKDLHSQPELACLPCDYFKHHKTMGIIMKRARGNTLENSYKELQKKTLSERLALAYRIARGMAVLHEAKIVHADVCSANIMIHDNLVQIIDVDGGGIPAKRIRPTIRGHGGGSWIAPEVFADKSKLPTIDSDRWSLAVVIHTIIIPALDPYYFLEKYADIHKVKIWPPERVGPNCQDILEIQKSHLKACEPFSDLLKITFNDGLHSSAKRIDAGALAEQLKLCLEDMVKCQHCKSEFIARNKHQCPICHKSLVAIRLQIREKGILLNGREAYLTVKDFKGADDENLLMFTPKGGRVHMKFFGLAKAKYQGKEIASDRTIELLADKSNLLEVIYNDKTLQVVFEKKVFTTPIPIKIDYQRKPETDTQIPHLRSKTQRRRVGRKGNIFRRFFNWIGSL